MNIIGGNTVSDGVRKISRFGGVSLAGFVFGACAFAQYGDSYPGIALSYAFIAFLVLYIGYYSVSAAGLFGVFGEERAWRYGPPAVRRWAAMLAALGVGVWLPVFVLTEHQARIIASVTWVTGQAMDSAISQLVSAIATLVIGTVLAAAGAVAVLALIPGTRRKLLRPIFVRWRARVRSVGAH